MIPPLIINTGWFMLEKSQLSQVAYLDKNLVVNKALDPEWVELIKEAKRYGFTIDEIRKILRKGA